MLGVEPDEIHASAVAVLGEAEDVCITASIPGVFLSKKSRSVSIRTFVIVKGKWIAVDIKSDFNDAALTDLSHPELDWVALAKGMGVPGVRVESAEALVTALERAFAESGPALIEALI